MPYMIVGLDFDYDNAGYVLKIPEKEYDPRYCHRKLSDAKKDLIESIDQLIAHLKEQKKVIKSLRVDEVETEYSKNEAQALCPES